MLFRSSGLFNDFKPQWVCHHAAQIDVRKSIKDPAFDAKVNIMGGLRVLDNCVKHEVEKLVYASSGGAVYGEPEYLPADEKHTIRPQSAYGVSKYSLERYLKLYYDNHGLEYVSLRYSNVYGPRQDPLGEAGVVAVFTEKFLNDESPTIYGDGSQTRDFVFVDDIVEANLKAFKYEGGLHVFNIGSGKETSINNLAEKIRSATGSEAEISYGRERKGEVKHIYLDCARAHHELNWMPKNNLDEGLAKTIDWHVRSKD